MPDDDPLTPAELTFRAQIGADQPRMRSVSPKYAAWAELARKSWTEKRMSATPAETEPRRKNK